MTGSLDELIQRALDGEATAAERAELEARLAADPHARARHEELVRVFLALEEARTEDPPAGLRDDVLNAIRGAAPAWRRAPARPGRPIFSWLRLVLPVAGAVAALAVFVTWQGLDRPVPGDGMSGAMSGADLPSRLRLGSGGDAVFVHSGPAEGGFRVTIQSGDAPVTVVLEAVGPGIVLRLSEPAAPPASSRIEAAVPAHSRVVAEGTSGSSRALVRVSVTLPGGESARGEIGLQGLQPAP